MTILITFGATSIISDLSEYYQTIFDRHRLIYYYSAIKDLENLAKLGYR